MLRQFGERVGRVAMVDEQATGLFPPLAVPELVVDQYVTSLGMVAEGVLNTLTIHEAARRAGVRTPIIDSIYSILHEGKSVPLAMKDLLCRDPRPESDGASTSIYT